MSKIRVNEGLIGKNINVFGVVSVKNKIDSLRRVFHIYIWCLRSAAGL